MTSILLAAALGVTSAPSLQASSPMAHAATPATLTRQVVATAAIVNPTLVPTAALKKAGGITINRIGTRYVGGTARTTVKPSVKASGQVVVVRKALTVTRGKKVVARNKTAVKLPAGTYKLTTKVTYKTYRLVDGVRVYAGARSVSASQSLAVRKLTRTKASASGNCPSWARIKGNNNSKIYHVPGGRYYKITKRNVTCFSSTAVARKAGFRASKR